MVIDNFSQILVSHVEILPFFRHVILSCRKIRASSTRHLTTVLNKSNKL